MSDGWIFALIVATYAVGFVLTYFAVVAMSNDKDPHDEAMWAAAYWPLSVPMGTVFFASRFILRRTYEAAKHLREMLRREDSE